MSAARAGGAGRSASRAGAGSASSTSAPPTTAPPVRRAALWVPDWPVVAAMAQAGLGSEVPAAVLHGRGMLAVSAAARAAGVRRGMRKRQAQRACPELAILPHDEGRDARAFEEVALGAEEVVSGIEVTRPGLLMIPAGGAARFHGGEHALVEALVVAATERSGAEVNVGIADGLLAAVEAARESLVVPPGDSPAYLAPLPASTLTHVAVERRHLASVEDLVSVLDRLGIRTLGDFAALPFADVLARFGSAGAWAHRLASGGDLLPPVLRRTEQDIAVRYEFEDPPSNVEQAAFVARHVAGLLDSALRDAGVRCLRVSIAVATERGEELERTWRTDVGPREGAFARHMADRVRWQLEGWLSGITLGPEASALTAITLTARDVIGGGAEQAFLWGGVSGADGRAHRAMERIQGLAGAEAVLVATEQGGRTPRDRASLIPFGQVGRSARRVDRPWPGQLPDPAPATVLVAPEPVRVLDAGGRDVVVTERLYVSAAPTWVAMSGEGGGAGRGGTSGGGERTTGTGARGERTTGEPIPVDAWAGPWPVVERWWSEDASRRAYLQVALRDGRAVLVASRQGQWTLEAVYDYMPQYAELHAHTAFSFLDGASHPEVMAAEAGRLGLSALAVTDHDGLYGIVRFAGAARAIGLPTVFGAELHLAISEEGRPPVLDPPTGIPDPRASHLVVLARGPAGYARLSRAIGLGHLATGQKGAAHYTMEGLAEAAAGEWLVLTGCRKGPVRRALAAGRGEGAPVTPAGYAAARRELDRLAALFGAENVAVEITDHGGPYDSERNDALADLAFDAGLALVATTNAHYATPRDADLAGAISAVRARSSLDDMDGWLPSSPGVHLRSAEEMLRRHWRHPEAVGNAARLAADLAFDLALVAPNLPPYPVPEGHHEASWLRELTYKGAQERYGPRGAERVKGAYAQIDHELQVIEALNFPGYFLIVHDLVQFCRDNDILCQGRGSAANSAVCYALGVTAVDAVTHGLLFERFLAPERDGPPDIDVDIESDRREEVIQYVYERFGRINAAMVANVIQYRPRSAVRDAAKALGYGVGQQDAWSKSIDRWHALRVPKEKAEEFAATQRDAVWPEPPPTQDLDHIPEPVLDLADRLMRLPRHLGVHPGGMVLCDRPVIDVCPVEWARMPGRTVLQWDKDDCAEAGLVKFDLLGLGMLSALKYAFSFARETQGDNLTLHGLPQEDPRVYDLLCAADTVGVFQVESRAQMATLPRLRPRKFYDIVVEVALIRPGPIQGGSVHPYINRARGREEVTYLHPLLEPALKKTLGVPLFQEQLMQMAMDACGFDGSAADQLRRAMGSKRSPERMEALRARALVGMHERGIEPDVAHAIFEKFRAFADFGFPESHSFSFAYLVYASAWLKVHRPAAFYAGLLAAQPMGFYSPQSLAADARRHGVTVLRPCVTRSVVQARVERLAAVERPGEAAPTPEAGFAAPVPTPEQPKRSELREDLAALVDADPTLAVRMGLAAVRGVGEDVAAAIVRARDEAPFRDMRDMARRVRIRAGGALGEEVGPERGLSVAQWEALATAGALETLGVTRREGLWASGALALEGPDSLPGVAVGVDAPTLPGMSDVEMAVADVWASGVSADAYPTAFVRDRLDANGVLRVADVFTHEAERRVAAAGVVTHRQRPGTAKGVTFLSLEDETGVLNVICSQGVWRRFQAVARRSPALVVRGRIERADGATNLVAEHLAPLSLKVSTTSRDFR